VNSSLGPWQVRPNTSLLAYNLKRVIGILGMPGTMEAMRLVAD
jgi:hypothetical protein